MATQGKDPIQDDAPSTITLGAQKRRRRQKGAEPLSKATFQLSESVMLAVRAAVQRGDAPSANAFVEEAIVARIREIRKSVLSRAYAEAMGDAAFRADMEDTTRAFESALADGLSSADDGR
jgi:hypothetical protein